MARPTGLGENGSLLMRSTVPLSERLDGEPAPPDDVEHEGPESPAAESPTSPAGKTRRKRPAPTGKTKARNLALTDDIHDRLWLLARQRKQSVSAVANELLDRALPRWDVKRIG